MPDLNKYIAEEIMGEKFCAHDFKRESGNSTVSRWVCKKCGRLGAGWASTTKEEVDEAVVDVPELYTTDLHLARYAIQKAFGFRYTLLIKSSIVIHVVRYSVSLRHGGKVGDGSHDELATAICLAIHKLKTGKDWKNA